MKKFLIVAKDAGNLRNGGLPVAEALQQRGHQIMLLRQEGYSANDLYAQDKEVQTKFPSGCAIASGSKNIRYNAAWADAVITCLSASGFPNVEIEVTVEAFRQNRPVFTIEEVPGGRNNPEWRDHQDLLGKCHQVFSVWSEDPWENETVIGPMNLGRYKNIDWDGRVGEVRSQLQIDADLLVVWCLIHPNVESQPALWDVAKAVIEIQKDEGDRQKVFILTRHHREARSPVTGNAATCRAVLRYLHRYGVKTIDCSLDLPSLMKDSEFHRTLLADQIDLLSLCRVQGVVVSGFCTSAFVDAPSLRIPSVLYLDHFSWGALLQAEKQLEVPPWPSYRFAESELDLRGMVEDYLSPSLRDEMMAALAMECKVRSDPAGDIAEEILRLM